jgi:N-acetyl-anhydromuramyl-L-alanine amidase AmpD
MSTHLVYNRLKVQDIGVRVISYLEAEQPGVMPTQPGQFPPIANPGIPSFYYPPRTRNHYGARNEFAAMLDAPDPRKQGVNKVVLHHDGMPTSLGCFMVLKDRELSTHIMINFDGTVYQPLDLMHVAYHAGGGANEGSVGLDLCQPVKPERCARGDSELRRGGYFTGTINGGTARSLGYTDEQYESLIAVLRGLKGIFPSFELTAPIDESGKVARNKLVDNIKFRGIVAHWHIIASKWDPGPGFDWERVLIGVRGSQLYYPVTLPGTRNLSQTPKEQALEAAEPYFRITEDGEGGYFPIGVNQAWHSGIHMAVPRGTAVLCPADGQIVVARNTSPDERLGSPNFVLVKHEVGIGDGKKTVFSLLMHLRKEKIANDSEVPWIRRLVARGIGDEALPEDENQSAPGFKGFLNERIALLDVDVKAGETLGFTDQFNSDMLGGGELQNVLDFAMFSSQSLTQKGAGAFEIVEDDADADILCNARSIWKRIVRKPEELRGLVEGSYPLAPSDVREFYNDKKLPTSMRWVAAKHPLEWSDKTEYDQLFGGGVDFEWSARKQARRFLQKIRKFLWWDDGVTKHAELPSDRMVYCYHPITLLAWVALGEARSALRPGPDGVQKVLTGDDLKKARAEDAAAEAQLGGSLTNCNLTMGDEQQNAIDTDKTDTDNHENEGWMRWEQGEWDPE